MHTLAHVEMTSMSIVSRVCVTDAILLTRRNKQYVLRWTLMATTDKQRERERERGTIFQNVFSRKN
jgi:hypothetical protein